MVEFGIRHVMKGTYTFTDRSCVVPYIFAALFPDVLHKRACVVLVQGTEQSTVDGLVQTSAIGPAA